MFISLRYRCLAVALTLAAIFGMVAFMGSDQSAARKFIPSLKNLLADKGLVSQTGCHVNDGRLESPECTFGAVGSNKKVVLFGDSHASQWAPALIKIATKNGWELIVLTRGNCKAALVEISPYCDQWRLNSLERIRLTKPGLVVVASSTGANTQISQNGQPVDRTTGEPLMRQGMQATLEQLMSTGAKVTLIRDLPASKQQLPEVCLRQNQRKPDRCAFPVVRPLKFAYDFHAARMVPGVQIIDPLPKVCPGGKCPLVAGKKGRVVTYRDRGHISATYAATLSKWLGARIQKHSVTR